MKPTTDHPDRGTRRVSRTLLLYALLAASSAVMLFLSLPGYDRWYLSFVALVPLLIVIQRTPARTAGVLSWLTGFFFFLLAVSWLNHLSTIGWVMLAFYLSLSLLVFAVVVRAAARGCPQVPFIVGVPAAWVALELVRGFPLGGFCWHYVGHNLYRQTVLIQVADFSGVYGISFLVVTVNALVARVIHLGLSGELLSRRHLVGAALGTAYAVALLWGAMAYGGWRLDQAQPTPGPMLSVVQGNIPQEIKDYAQAITLEQYLRKRDQVFNTYRTLTLRLLGAGDDLVVWPETVVPVLEGETFRGVDYSAESERRVREVCRELGRALLVGSIRRVHDKSEVRDYNAAYFLRADDAPFEVYLKIHLVPFGEFIPMGNVGWIKRVLEKFLPEGYEAELSAGREPVVFRVKDAAFATPICYEDTKPSLIREFRRRGARFIVNLTNDGWFGPSAELDQHLANSVFRTVENRVALVRAANTGISAFIDPRGLITSFVADEETGRYREVAGVLTDRVMLDARRTFYTAWGDVFAWLTVAGAAGWALAGWRMGKARGGRAPRAGGP